MTRTSRQVAILIVTHQSVKFVRKCAEAALKTGAAVLIIDNASTDGTVEAANIQGVRVIANAINRGFAGAINQGVEATDAPYLLMLNPDAVLQTGIAALVDACEVLPVGAAGGQLVDAQGVPQRGFVVRHFPSAISLSLEVLMINRVWPRNAWNWYYRCLDQDLLKAANVDQPAGAFLMFRRDAWLRVSGIDEEFFPIWFEDVDFCKRLREAGYTIRYQPEARAYHSGAHSALQVPLRRRTECWYGSLLRYSTLHFGAAGRVLTSLSVVAGSILRICFGGVEHRNREMLTTYKNVVGLAVKSLGSKTSECRNIGEFVRSSEQKER